ncbi:MAG TPA: hypothetical protein DDW65_22945 [Firmicutes bacterium]|jgi:hypothetical protein|nr:hypothetical protein [Bacillota bacterium]
MTTKSILNPDFFKVLDEDTRELYYGCNQEWYTTKWQRLSGCGPTVASDLILYLFYRTRQTNLGMGLISKKNCLELMEEIWQYVTPTMHGVSNTKMFYEALFSYAEFKGFHVQYRFLDLPNKRLNRPSFSELLNFLDEAFSKDTPVAFLNLCNGDEKGLDRWHWVTIIALEYTENGDQAFADIIDDGKIKRINLALWYHTTSKAGGFVYFTT